MLNENTNNIDVTPLGAFDGEEDDALEVMVRIVMRWRRLAAGQATKG
jgi:hypothetical protein